MKFEQEIQYRTGLDYSGQRAQLTLQVRETRVWEKSLTQRHGCGSLRHVGGDDLAAYLRGNWRERQSYVLLGTHSLCVEVFAAVFQSSVRGFF